MRDYFLCLAFGLALALTMMFAERVFDLSSGAEMQADAGLLQNVGGRL